MPRVDDNSSTQEPREGFTEQEARSRAFRTNRVQRVEEGKKTFQAEGRDSLSTGWEKRSGGQLTSLAAQTNLEQKWEGAGGPSPRAGCSLSSLLGSPALHEDPGLYTDKQRA